MCIILIKILNQGEILAHTERVQFCGMPQQLIINESKPAPLTSFIHKLPFIHTALPIKKLTG